MPKGRRRDNSKMGLSFKTSTGGIVNCLRRRGASATSKAFVCKPTSGLGLWAVTAVALGTAGFLAFTVAPVIGEEASATTESSQMNVDIAVVLSLAIEVWNPDKSGWGGVRQ